MVGKHFVLVGALFLGVVGMGFALDSSEDIPAMETSMANRIEPLVKEIGGVSKAWVWVTITPDLARWRDFVKTLAATGRANPGARPKPLPRTPDILPGVSTDEMAGIMKGREQSIANRAVNGAERSRTSPDLEAAIKMAAWFRKISVRVAVPASIAPDRLHDLRLRLPVLIGLRPGEGDLLIVETMPEAAPPAPAEAPKPRPWAVRFAEWFEQLSPQMIALWICILAAIAFLFGPIRAFLRDAAGALQTIRVQTQSSGTMDSQSRIKRDSAARVKGADLAEISGPSPLALGAGTPEEPEIMPHGLLARSAGSANLFGFITEQSLNNLIQICQEETPEHIVMLVTYLRPAWAGRIISGLSPEKRQVILSFFTGEVRFEPEEVTVFAKRLQETINFVSGGPERLLELLEQMEDGSKGAVMKDLQHFFPDTAREIQGKLITYMDLFRLPPKDLQKLLWEAYRTHIKLAVLMATLNDQGRQYLIQQLPESIAPAIAAEIGTVGHPTPEQFNREERSLVHLARSLEKTGDIGAIPARSGTGEAA